MPGPVERWLGTFMCKQYAYLFEDYGFKTLPQVCQLQPSTLHSMGIPPDHCDKILENVSVLRQSLVASSPEHMGSHDASFPPPSYNMRHNMHSPHYPGSAGPGCTYQEHPYENQMQGNHNQSNNYSYHPSTPYPPVSPSTQQYNNHNNQMHSNIPYSNSQTYSGSQGGQYANQEIYGQQMGYNNRMHQSQVNWENNPSHDMRTYNQSPRNMIGSPPPPSVMRSPPSGGGMTMSHYRQMMINNIAEQSPHSWSQSQIPSPGMMHSPRTTPSPGIGHAPGNLASPNLPNRSPAHKPFSPPPFSSHGPPPPAHQQSLSNYDFPGTHSMSPAPLTTRPMASPNNQNSSGGTNNSSDPLQSLQKMVMQEGQQTTSTNFASNPGADQQTINLQKSASNFGSIEQLVAKENSNLTNSSSPSLSSLSSSSSSHHNKSKSPSSEIEHTNTISSSIESDPLESKEETSDSLIHNQSVSDQNEQEPHSPHGNVSSASSPQSNHRDLPTEDKCNSVDQRTTVNECNLCNIENNNSISCNSSSINNNNNNDHSDKFNEKQSGFESDDNLLCNSNSVNANGFTSVVVHPPRQRWKNSSVNVVKNEMLDSNLDRKHAPSGTQYSFEQTYPNYQMSNGGSEINEYENNKIVAGNLSPKGGKFRKRQNSMSRMLKRTSTANDSTLLHSRSKRSNSVDSICNSLGQGNCIISPESHDTTDTPRKLRGRRASVAGRLENMQMGMELNPVNSKPVGIKSFNLSDNMRQETVFKKYRGPVPRLGNKSPVYVDLCNSGAEKELISIRQNNKSPRKEKSPVRMKKSPVLNLRSPDQNFQFSTNLTDISYSMKTVNSTPPRTNSFMSHKVPSLIIPIGGATPSVKLSDCSKHLREDLKYSPPDKLKENNINRSRCVDNYPAESQESNVFVGTILGCGDAPQDLHSPPKKKRGRPLGSKNKPKPPGFEKPKRVKKQKSKESSASAAEESPNAKRSVEKIEQKKKIEMPTDSKPRGPFIHIEGSINSPTSVTIVNVPNKDDEGDSKGYKKKKVHVREGGNVLNSGFTKRKLAKVGYTSTLSSKYDAVKKDRTWICDLCHKGSHYRSLGDLFGPYFEAHSVENTSKEKQTSEPLQNVENSEATEQSSFRKVRAKRKRSELVEEFFKSTMAKKGKRKEMEKEVSPSESAEQNEVLDSATLEDFPKELWVHEDCIVWSHGVYLVGSKVCGLNEAIRIAADMICCKCKEAGATLGCFNKGCAEQYHFICAVEKGCHLDEENYSMLCPKHKKKPRHVT